MTVDETASSQASGMEEIFAEIGSHLKLNTTTDSTSPKRKAASGQHSEEPTARDVLNELLAQAWPLGEVTVGGSGASRGSGKKSPVQHPRPPGLTVNIDFTKKRINGLLTAANTTEVVRFQNVQRAICLLLLWDCCWELWDETLADKTMYTVISAVTKLVKEWLTEGSTELSVGDCDPSVLQAIPPAFEFIRATIEVFKAVNLSRAALTEKRATEAAAVLVKAQRAMAQACTILKEEQRLWSAQTQLPQEAGEGFRVICEALVCLRDKFELWAAGYESLGLAAGSVAEFESWMESHWRIDSATGATSNADMTPKPLGSLERSKSAVRDVIHNSPHVTKVATRLRPWLHLLECISDAMKDPSGVFIPTSLQIRYCFPFAIDYGDGKRNLDDVDRHLRNVHPALSSRVLSVGTSSAGRDPRSTAGDGDADQCGRQLSAALNVELAKADRDIMPKDPKLMPLTEFWLGAGEQLYGGIRISLGDVAIGVETDSTEERETYSAWIDLSRMGNNCLCVELKRPFDTRNGRIPYPHVANRHLRTASNYAIGSKVWMEEKGRSEPATDWDDLNRFAQDVISATTYAICYPDSRARNKVRKKVSEEKMDLPVKSGNTCVSVRIDTDKPLGDQAEDIANRLDSLLGGRIFVRSGDGIAFTVNEWLRFPPYTPPKGDEVSDIAAPPQITRVPGVGFVNDWFIETGFLSTFGSSGTPSWATDHFLDVAQFVASWPPLLKLWTSRLEKAVRRCHLNRGGTKISDQLRVIEQDVRHHATQLRSSQLCTGPAERQLLDLALLRAGIPKQEAELQSLLKDAQTLTDWYDERRRRGSESARNILLFIIGLFGVFAIVDYMSLADSEKYRGFARFLTRNPGREFDIFFVTILLVFLAAFGAVNARRLQRCGEWIARTVRDRYHRLRLRRATAAYNREADKGQTITLGSANQPRKE